MPSIPELLDRLLQGNRLTSEQRRILTHQTLTDTVWANPSDLDPGQTEQLIEERLALLRQVYPTVAATWQQQQITTSCLDLLWRLWLPLAQQLITARQQIDRPWIQGILGMQGAGKTTLTTLLCTILNTLGYPSGTLSIDDLYKTYADRQTLRQQDPRLIWRGPPGTHDIELGIQILDQLRHCQPNIQVPRFDKSAYGGQGDRSGFEPLPPAEIVFFEGWFVGMTPVSPAPFDQPLPPIQTPEDQQFARDMNQQLQTYVPLWERLDDLLVLKLTDYQLSKRWRTEAERKAIAAGRAGMSDAEVSQFVDYFWKALHPELFIPPLVSGPAPASLIIEVDDTHNVATVYRNTPPGS